MYFRVGSECHSCEFVQSAESFFTNTFYTGRDENGCDVFGTLEGVHANFGYGSGDVICASLLFGRIAI